MEHSWEYTYTYHYVLETSSGEQMIFYILACAEIYRIIHGGEIHRVEVKIGDGDDRIEFR